MRFQKVPEQKGELLNNAQTRATRDLKAIEVTVAVAEPSTTADTTLPEDQTYCFTCVHYFVYELFTNIVISCDSESGFHINCVGITIKTHLKIH